jgi:hypothetical protein
MEIKKIKYKGPYVGVRQINSDEWSLIRKRYRKKGEV